MTEYFDPRAELDYSDFHAVNDDQPVRIIPKGIDADPVGNFPRQSFAPGEREQFEDTRARLDRALQANGMVPVTPQEGFRPVDYEANLLKALAKKTGGLSRLKLSPKETSGGVIAECTYRNVVADALAAPAREGRLAEIKTVDATGREVHEFVGNKGVWMNPLKAPVTISPIFIDDVPQHV